MAIRLADDGSAGVTETIQIFALTADGADFGPDRGLVSMDRVTDINLSLNGVAVADQPSPVIAPGVLRLRWRLPRSEGENTLTLNYRASGAFGATGGRVYVEWPIDLVSGQEAGGHPMRVAIEWPAAWVPVSPPGINQPGWTVAALPHGLVAEKAKVYNERATLIAELAIGGQTIPKPDWQFRQERADELGPAFTSGAVFILIVGVGVLWILRWQRKEPGADANVEEVASGLRSGGLALIAIGAACAVAAGFFYARYNWPPMTIAGSIVVVGIVLYLSGRRS